MRPAAPALALLLLCAALLAAAPVAPATTADETAVRAIALQVDGETAHGLVAFPEGMPTALVVIAHGYGHAAESHRGHLDALAQEHGAAAIAMDYRGTGFPLRAGADDTLAATAFLKGLYPDVRPVILYSVSMGTAVSSMVLAEAPGTFDYWVNNEGLSMLHETWAGASALAPGNGFAAQAQADIEAECGGTPAHAPDCYLERSAALRAVEFGLQGAWLTHGLHDGLVPYNQGREMVAALRAAGVPTDFYTAVRGEAGGEGTTITGYAGFQVDGLAGHGTESDDTHTLTALSFGLLYALVDGDLLPPADREVVVDREFDTLV